VKPEFDKIWKDFDTAADINAKSSRGQTLLYAACRSGRTWIVDRLIRVPGIELNGPQESKNGSTALHGANWGGYFEIMAILLTCGAVPETNTNTGDKKEGLFPEEEGNKQLEKATLYKLKEFWAKYKEKNKAGVQEYLPPAWEKPQTEESYRTTREHRRPRTRFQ